MFYLRPCGDTYSALSRPKYRAQPPFFESRMYEACARSRHSRGGSFLTSFYENGATKFDGLSDIPTIFKLFWKFLRTGLYHATDCKIIRRFRTTALPIVRLNSLRRIDGSTTNKAHSLTKREIQTQTAKLFLEPPILVRRYVFVNPNLTALCLSLRL
jgi:hypothetical protein